MNAVVRLQLSSEQIDDLATLFSRTLARGNLAWISNAVLGDDVLRQNGNIVDMPSLSKILVTRLHEADAIPSAVALLHRESHHNGYLCVSLSGILRGERLDSDNLQRLITRTEPFFNSAEFQRMLPRVRGVVCAVALGDKILGTGFLIGPDLVMTNFHVIKEFLEVDPAGNPIRENGDGRQLRCVFDYQFEPPPRLNDDREEDRTTLVVQATPTKWLIHARKLLQGDGTDKVVKVEKAFDYAVIQLAKRVGEKPSRIGGGNLRGWLELPAGSIDYTGDRRVVLFQHPAGAAQQMDVGEFVGLDSTSTRVRYRVSSARGSSGGAAVGLNGELLALHNAEVRGAPDTAILNQGVRVDMIAEDLQESVVGWKPPKTSDQQPISFWSLTDSIRNPRPIIGRESFRRYVVKMMEPGAERVLSVIGEYGTFARFSVSLLQRTLGSQALVARFTLSNISSLSPEEFVSALMDQLGVYSDPADPMPIPPATEMAERTQGTELPSWVLRQLGNHGAKQPGIFPAWVAIDVTVPEGESVLWKRGLHDLVTALVGARDAGLGVEIPQLRWLFLSTTALPWGNARRLQEVLRDDTEKKHDEDFAACMRLAWLAIDKFGQPGDQEFLFTLAEGARLDNDQQPKAERLPVRKALALEISRVIGIAARRKQL